MMFDWNAFGMVLLFSCIAVLIAAAIMLFIWLSVELSKKRLWVSLLFFVVVILIIAMITGFGGFGPVVI